MNLNSLMKDSVDIYRNGEIIQKDLKASVQGKKIISTDKKLDIEDGDEISRKLPNGKQEVFIVDNAKYFEAGPASHWSLDVSKKGAQKKQSGSYTLSDEIRSQIASSFDAGMATERETLQMMKTLYEQSGYVLDPHTAVACHVAQKNDRDDIPMIILATAHPAKFPATVRKATAIDPALPSWAENLLDGEEEFIVLANDRTQVEAFIQSEIRMVLNV